MALERRQLVHANTNISSVPVGTLYGGQLIYKLGDLAMAVHYDADQWVAVEAATGMFGEGDTELEALRDLVVSLYELRGDLAGAYENLDDRLEQQLRMLSRSLPSATPPGR